MASITFPFAILAVLETLITDLTRGAIFQFRTPTCFQNQLLETRSRFKSLNQQANSYQIFNPSSNHVQAQINSKSFNAQQASKTTMRGNNDTSQSGPSETPTVGIQQSSVICWLGVLSSRGSRHWQIKPLDAGGKARKMNARERVWTVSCRCEVLIAIWVTV